MIHQLIDLAGRNSLNRRRFMESTAKMTLGVSLGAPFLTRSSARGQAAAPAAGAGKATSLIYIYLGGGMSHLDTFDPKTSKDVMGGTELISTKADPIKLGNLMPKLADHTPKMAVINSMFSTNGAHEQGEYIMRTGYNKISTIVHPTVGAFAQELLGKRGEILPDSVVVGQSTSNAGYLSPALSPLPIADPSGGVPNTLLLTDQERFDRRMEMASKLGKQFVEKFKYNGPKSYVEYYDQANKLLKSSELEAFDLSGESAREAFGMNRLGQGCLLARRLVEKGVRVIEVVSGGWDMHENLQARLQERVPELDQALSALLQDLDEKGLLATTLVAVGTEFGRTPVINANSGRDHHPAAYSSMLAGGGIKGGIVYGASDKQGKKVAENPVKPEDFLATIGHAMGVPLDQTIYSPSRRPFTFANDGKPVEALFA